MSSSAFAYLISSVAEARDNASSFFLGNGFDEVISRRLPHQWCSIVTCSGFELTTTVLRFRELSHYTMAPVDRLSSSLLRFDPGGLGPNSFSSLLHFAPRRCSRTFWCCLLPSENYGDLLFFEKILRLLPRFLHPRAHDQLVAFSHESIALKFFWHFLTVEQAC